MRRGPEGDLDILHMGLGGWWLDTLPLDLPIYLGYYSVIKEVRYV